jgi:hypothetical protein
VVLGHPTVVAPATTPTPVAVPPDTTGPDTHSGKPAKGKHHDKKPHKVHKPKADRPHHDRPQAAIHRADRGHKSGRRLRVRRRAR